MSKMIATVFDTKEEAQQELENLRTDGYEPVYNTPKEIGAITMTTRGSNTKCRRRYTCTCGASWILIVEKK